MKYLITYIFHFAAHVGDLAVAPSETLQMSMRDFVYNFVFNQDLPEDTNDSWEAQERIAQALLARRKMLTGFLRLVMYKNVDLIHAAPVLAQYMRVSGSAHVRTCVQIYIRTYVLSLEMA